METNGKTSKTIKKFKNRKLMQNTVIGLVLVFLLFLSINRITSIFLTNKLFYGYLDNHLLDSATYTRAILYEYEETLPWLISYWSENNEEMDIPRNENTLPTFLNTIFDEWDKEKDIFSCDNNDLKMMSEEDKKKYAQASYLVIASKFDNLANTYGNMNFFCTREIAGSTSEMILFLGMNENNQDPYMLGTLYEVDSLEKSITSEFDVHEDVSAYYVTASTNVLPETLDNTAIDNENRLKRESYSYYVITLPVYDVDNNRIASVSVGYDSAIVDKEIKYNIQVSDIVIIIIMVFIFIIVILLMRLKVIKPIEIVSDAVCNYIRTKNSYEVASNLDMMISAPKKTEIDTLAESFYDMALEIDKYTEEIRITAAEKEKKKTEMEMAKTIQMGQLPSVSEELNERNEFELFASMIPAREVGGDFYDFFMLDDDHLVLVIADVSDKGVPAALFMMTSKALIRSELKGGKDLKSAMYHVNNLLDDTNAANMFVTVWAAVIELSTGIVKSVNAGHESPAIKKAGGLWKLEEVPHSIPVACMPQVEFVENKWVIAPGDYIFVYTDGVPDATNMEGKRFGTTRMIEALNQCSKEKPEEIIKEIDIRIGNFEGDEDAFDDTTMLCFMYKGAQCNELL